MIFNLHILVGMQIIIDIHVHTKEFSPGDSILSIDEAIDNAKTMGLDGLCFTDHDDTGTYDIAENLSRYHNMLIIPGIEVFTTDGDILVFGLDRMPRKPISSAELIDLVEKMGGAAVSAHPYRPGSRGLGDLTASFSKTLGIEVLNGRTSPQDNLRALKTASEHGMPSFGGSDAHTPEEVGRFATKFPKDIENIQGFIRAINDNDVQPVFHNGQEYSVLKTLSSPF